MKYLAITFTAFICIVSACKSTGSMAAIQPASGTIDLPANGETRMWRNLEHPSFKVTITNNASNQTCEVYKVTANGNEKWVHPSLQAGKSITLTIPENGHLMLTNANPTALKIDYKVQE